jgi:glycosyltransferase involved in cell wall biosynthesis
MLVVGDGPEHTWLQKMAGPTITFAPPASDEDVAKHMRSAEAFVFASFDDFGVTPVEALAAGMPVIAYKAGGAFDYIVPGKTGEFFGEQTVEALGKALRSFDSSRYKTKDIQHFAEQFSPEVFRKNMQQLIEQARSRNP